jgi:hypothetical protein
MKNPDTVGLGKLLNQYNTGSSEFKNAIPLENNVNYG